MWRVWCFFESGEKKGRDRVGSFQLVSFRVSPVESC